MIFFCVINLFNMIFGLWQALTQQTFKYLDMYYNYNISVRERKF